MRVPNVNRANPRDSISPSLYISGRKCLARMAWASSDAVHHVPAPPSSLLGQALHKVQEMADTGTLPAAEDVFRKTAAEIFDAYAAERLAKAHPLLRIKYSHPDEMPNYYLQRARAVELAVERRFGTEAGGTTTGLSLLEVEDDTEPESPPLIQSEMELRSPDGLLYGRSDCVDADTGRIIDYKSGSSSSPPTEMSDDEQTQLLLYAYIARANGLSIREGIIQRATGERAVLQVGDDEATKVAAEARQLLERYNESAKAGVSPAALSSPSPIACSRCPFIPLCPAFWGAATSDWRDAVGTQVEIQVCETSTQGPVGRQITNITGVASRGTVTPGSELSLRFPRAWLGEDVTRAGTPGRELRITHARLGGEDGMVRRQLIPYPDSGAVWVL